MRAVISDWESRNRITTPLAGEPAYVNSGIIKAVMKTGEKISIAQIDYQEFDEENFQYVISPYWEIIDGLPSSVFQGIPGIDMELRLERYYRVNYIPTFIAERTPSENREDLWELLEAVGLDYYDRFEWLLRTTMRAANDNLIVEKRRESQVIEEFMSERLPMLQYGDKLIVDACLLYTSNVLFVVPILLDLLLLTFAVSTIFAHFGVFFNDLKNLTNVGLRVLFYMSGIFYVITDRVNEAVATLLLRINPIGFLIDACRESLVYCHTPNYWLILLWFVVGLALSVIGIRTIYKNENNYVKVI